MTHRVKYTPVHGSDDVFTSAFLQYLADATDQFSDYIHELRAKRKAVLQRALKLNKRPGHLPPSEATETSWQVPTVPEDLRRPGIEITGPASITNMFINAINPVGGERATGDLDDDEDAASHRLIDTVTATRNRLAAVKGTLVHHDEIRNRHYKIEDGELPFFMHRERGLHLDELDVTVDGRPVPATILGMGLTLFYAGRAQMECGQGVYFYLPKMESAEEASFYRSFFDFSRKHMGLPETGIIRAIALVESLPIAFQMEEVLYALGPYAAGLNAARWDLKASIFEFVMTDPMQVWPDRFDVDVKTTAFIANIFRRLVAICLKHDAVPIGGMATALPSKDQKINEAAAKSITADKEWEAAQGFLRGWVAHIFHLKTAAAPFKELHSSGWKPTEKMRNPDNYPIRIEVPKGTITVHGTRRNARMLIEYLEGWINGRGAKGIDSQAGQPGVHGPLMEDLATGRMSVAQIAQRIIHSAKDADTGQSHDFRLVKRLMNEEIENILLLHRGDIPKDDAKSQAMYNAAEIRYRKALKLALRWVKNYTDLDFRSLGSYSRDNIETIAAAPDAF